MNKAVYQWLLFIALVLCLGEAAECSDYGRSFCEVQIPDPP